MRAISLPIVTLGIIFLTACSEIEKPQTVPFYAESKPPAKQEFRWSNGKAPKSFDPARAAAAPETDIVRALYEGLTDIDPRTLREVPAVAEKWTSSDDLRVWTFQLRKDARWSNGERVAADDFVTSWKRLATLGEKSAHRELFQNIVGLRTPKAEPVIESPDFMQSASSSDDTKPHRDLYKTLSATSQETLHLPPNVPLNDRSETKINPATKPLRFGVEAIDENTVRVTLVLPDKDFPKLVANPIFRPVYGEGNEFKIDPLSRDIVTNGPFRIAGIDGQGIVLDRSETYWKKAAVSLERVRFVPKENSEAALDAYRKNEIDAVTNAEFAPLALKLLVPYDDFRQTTHSALNFYEFNIINPPFNDRRVREALAISIDRKRLTEGELEGSARPASSFLPLGEKKNARIGFDAERARQLVEDAGFLTGAGFPKIRLLVNRNDVQLRVARAIVRMWKQNLNIETEIIVKELSEIENARGSGEYDLVRRGVVLPTADERASMAAIFGTAKSAEPAPEVLSKNSVDERTAQAGTQESFGDASSDLIAGGENTRQDSNTKGILTEEQAIFEFSAIPLYFPMSYSLVKPYVKGFEINGLDAMMLNNISIDSNWQSPAARD